ncbi:anti-phage dCTP deaminase [soil metagenome]
MTHPEVADGLKKVFARRGDFVVIGLTGRTGSGCTTSATLLSKEFSNLRLPTVKTDNASAEERKYRIVHDFVERNWRPFFSLSMSNVLLSFLLDKEDVQLRDFFSQAGLLPQAAQLEGFITSWRPAQEIWQRSRNEIYQSNTLENKQALLTAWQGPIQDFFRTVKDGLGPASTKILQLVGDNLRKSGDPFSSNHLPDRFYELPERAAHLIETVVEVQRSKGEPAYIVLDALRNPFELLYFRERFAAFYVVAISTPNEDRERRLSVRLSYTAKQIADMDDKEYPERNKPLAGYEAFTSQNIQSCLEKADIYLGNPGYVPPNQEINTSSLAAQLIKYFALMLHPGLTTPTRSERCMQIAFAARANSGCISRQVGAAITDANDSVKAVGWNDVPAGQVPCLLRRATDLINDHDQAAFSDYENKDSRFRERVSQSYKRYTLVDTGGRSSAFCFKTEYNTLTKQDNQVHTRSLHAEENAFLQIVKQGGQGIEGGKLYTTASPCELCAKKAFQLGIKNIYYIDPYPGISLTHILKSGAAQARPTVELFQGAVGTAYHRLYDPILPYKDELRALMEGKPEEQAPPAQPVARLL